jgi:hypothetical protein
LEREVEERFRAVMRDDRRALIAETGVGRAARVVLNDDQIPVEPVGQGGAAEQNLAAWRQQHFSRQIAAVVNIEKPFAVRSERSIDAAVRIISADDGDRSVRVVGGSAEDDDFSVRLQGDAVDSVVILGKSADDDTRRIK